MSKEQTEKIVDFLTKNAQEVSNEMIEYVKSIGQWGWHENK